jgi:hypothetical protein
MDKKEKPSEVKLTETEIAILKAGLEYYLLDDHFGYAIWGTIPGATFGSSDSYYRFKANEIYEKLEKMKKTKVKPDFGWWGDINKLGKLCEQDYKKAKRIGKAVEKKIYEELRGKETNEASN